MRIALVCPYDYTRPGGVQAHVRGLAAALATRGHAVTVIAPLASGNGSGTFTRARETGRLRTVPRDGEVPLLDAGQPLTRDGDVPLLDAGQPLARDGEVHLLDAGRPLTVPLSGTRIDVAWASRRTRARIAEMDFDVIHVHTPWNPFLPLQALACTPEAARVATFHDAPPHGLWGRLAGGLLMPLGGRLLVRRCLDAAIAVSEVPRRVVGRWLRPDEIRVIPNGIAWDAFAGPRRDLPFVLCLGRLEPRKGVADLVEAFARIRPRFPEVTLRIVGDGPLASVLRQRLAAIPGTSLEGAVSEAEKAALMRDCRVFCAPARYGESFGIVVAEAMASGAPVVAASNDGYRGLLADRGLLPDRGPLSDHGLLYPPGDIPALAAHLSDLLSDPRRRDDLSARGREASRAFDWGAVTDAIEAVYADALERRNRRRRVRTPRSDEDDALAAGSGGTRPAAAP